MAKLFSKGGEAIISSEDFAVNFPVGCKVKILDEQKSSLGWEYLVELINHDEAVNDVLSEWVFESDLQEITF